jgi:hypothetical protein
MKHVDVIIIGGGAAGLLCAATAGYRGKRVLVIEHAKQVGRKILMSGGGRCNFTNLEVDPTHFVSQNEHFCKSALSRFTPQNFIDLVNKHHIAYHEKTLGQLFCDGKASQIVTLLLDECKESDVTIQTSTDVISIKKDQRFSVHTNYGEYVCESLVIATGGLSIPSMGATGFGYTIAKQFGLNVIACEPSLVPLIWTAKQQKNFSELAGIALPVILSCHHQEFREAILFTHKGLSGPAILQISNYWAKGDTITINFLPGCILFDVMKGWQIERPHMELKNLLAELIPKRLAQYWLEHFATNKPVNQYNDKELTAIAALFQEWGFIPNSTEGYQIAEVTRGGVDTKELSSKTFESIKVPGLYFVGEVIDVTGWLGGFNFQWAWASGYCAGQYV